MEEVAEIIDQTVKGRISEIESKQEPVHYEMGRILRYSSIELSQVIKGVPEEDLEEIFGGHDFFHSALESLLKEKEKSSALHLGVAYLFINQILFYILLSNTAKMQGTPEIYPEIKNEDKNSPIKLRDNYFLKVRLKDYEPIYGPDVAQHFNEDTVGNFLIQLIDMLIELSPKLTVPDLVGQIFQNLIPFKIRKPLGAHFTNPKTAQLLAHLSIDDSDTTVLDPACGSGTLLVAAYKRKMELSPTDNLSRLHKRFIENEITGIDAMAFSSHLAAVNLALQQPLTDTDFVRIGRSDSTKLKPGDIIEPTGGSMPDAFLQTQLTGKASKKTKSQSRVPSMKAGKLRSIQLSKVNLVIMNPPFTSQNNLSKEYRILLKRRFVYPSIYKKIIFWKTSQQVYFLLLADKFLNKNGNIAAVLPFTTFTGHAFFPLINYYVNNYTIKSIIIGLGRCSFSENTSLSECLFIASKSKPSDGNTFKLIGVYERPENWADDYINKIIGYSDTYRKNDLCIIKEIKQTELLPENSTLSTLMLCLNDDYNLAWKILTKIANESKTEMVKIKELFKEGLEITEVYHGQYRPLLVGPKAIIACRTEERAIKQIDRLLYDSESDGEITLKDRFNPDSQYKFPINKLGSCIRRFSYFDTMNITNKTDFIVTKTGKELENTMNAYYTKKEKERFILRIKRAKWDKIIERGSSKVNIMARVDLAAKGTIFLAYRCEDPSFLIAYGYNVKGFKDENEEKLFTLWFNSTMGLIELLAHATINRGTWLKFEQFTTEQLTIPNPQKLSKTQWIQIEKLWNDLEDESVPPLVEQLEKNNEVRTKLDTTLLKIIGFNDKEALSMSLKLQNGALSSINMLKKTMDKT